MSKVCLEQKAKWWRVANKTLHVFVEESLCTDLIDGLYAEMPSGEKIIYTAELQKEITWDWTKLPADQIESCKSLYYQRKYVQLMEIHNLYRLSSVLMCCSTEAVRLNFRYAILKGII